MHIPSKINQWKRTLILFGGVLLSFAAFVRADDSPAPSNNPPAPAATGAGTAPSDVQAAMNLPPGPSRNAAITAAVNAWARTNPVDAVTYFGGVTDKGLRGTGLAAATDAWVASDEKSALDWGFNHGSGVQQHYLFGAYGKKNGQAAAEWILQQPKHNGGQFGSIMEGWTVRENGDQKKISEIAAWALNQKLSPDDAAGAAQFVTHAMAWNDPVATSVWVNGLPSTFAPKVAAETVANIWSRKIPADIPKIKDWISHLPLADDAKAEVNKSIIVPATPSPSSTR